MPRVLAVMPPIPVIIVTANADVSLAQEALKLGACDDVTTPCDFDDPEIAVRTALLAVDEPETRRDGQRFLMVTSQDSATQPITLVLHWQPTPQR